jgi:hypothetical protein
MLEDLFENGPRQITGLVVGVTIQSGSGEAGTPTPVAMLSPSDNQVGLLELIETEARPTTPISTPAIARESPSTNGPGSTNTPSGKITKGGDHSIQDSAAGSGLPKLTTAAEASPQSLTPARSGVTFLVGKTAAGEEVHWDPQSVATPLNNFGILVTGDPGSGKTQILRALIQRVVHESIPVCVFDFKNDYSEPSFAGPLGLTVFDVDRDGLPFNPLTLVGDHNGETRPIAHIHETAGILRRIFHLGDQQEAFLKRAMQQAYDDAGIKAGQRQRVDNLPAAPSFEDVVSILNAGGRGATALLNRLSPLFDLGLFPDSRAAKTSFSDLIGQSAVLDLHRLPDDRIKAAIAEFLIVRLHSHVLRGEQPRQLRRLLVFDEAWRVKDSVRLQELAREGRAFGVGIAIGTQFPGDIPETLAGNLASQLLLHNSEIEHRKSVARTLVGAASGPVAVQIIGQTQTLQKHEGFFRNQQYSPYVLVTTIPHYKRQEAPKGTRISGS